jgi:hypothetical protein
LVLPAASGVPASVSYTAIAGTATAGIDFLPVSGRLFFAPGQRTNFVVVPIVGDRDFEPNETVLIELSDPSGVVIPDTSIVLSIANDDPPPAPRLRASIGADAFPALAFDTVAGAGYVVQSRTNLAAGTWITDPKLVVGTGGTVVIRAPSSAADARYYRVVVP